MNIFRESSGLTRLPGQRAEGERISRREAMARLESVRVAFRKSLSGLSEAVTRSSAEERQDWLRLLINNERQLETAEVVYEQTVRAEQEASIQGQMLVTEEESAISTLERRVTESPELCQSMSPEELCELFNHAAPTTIRYMFEAGNLEQAIQFGAFPEMVILDQDGCIDLEGTKHWHSTGRHEQQDGILLNSPLAAVDRREPVSIWDFLRRRTGQVR